MRFQRGVNLLQLVADFVKDEEGNWWLVNVKAFLVEAKLRRAPRAEEEQTREEPLRLTDKEKYQKTKECRYCEKNYLESELTHKMTRKMLIEMDRYLLHIGKNFEWLARSDPAIDPHCLYQEFKICERWYHSSYAAIDSTLKSKASLTSKAPSLGGSASSWKATLRTFL